MIDHPVFVPTAEGPVGGIVSAPEGKPRAGIMLMPGYGRPARSGINSFWARLARELAFRGLAVLRVDYAREGETFPIGEGGSGQAWRRDLDLFLLGEALQWFRERLSAADLLLAGSCAGARAAIELAGHSHADSVAHTFLLVPHLQALYVPENRQDDVRAPNLDRAQSEVDPVDPELVDCLRTILRRAPSWVLIGERDTPDIPLLKRRLGSTVHDLEVELVPDVALHFLDQPPIQQLAAARLIARVETTLGASRESTQPLSAGSRSSP